MATTARPAWAPRTASAPQLHCPPTPVFSTDAVYDALDTLVAEQRIAAYGVSVETCAEALAAIARPGQRRIDARVCRGRCGYRPGRVSGGG